MIDFADLSRTQPPSDEGGGFLRSKKTEGEKAKAISLPQSKAELLTAPSSEGAQNTVKLPARQIPICIYKKEKTDGSANRLFDFNILNCECIKSQFVKF